MKPQAVEQLPQCICRAFLWAFYYFIFTTPPVRKLLKREDNGGVERIRGQRDSVSPYDVTNTMVDKSSCDVDREETQIATGGSDKTVTGATLVFHWTREGGICWGKGSWLSPAFLFSTSSPAAIAVAHTEWNPRERHQSLLPNQMISSSHPWKLLELVLLPRKFCTVTLPERPFGLMPL